MFDLNSAITDFMHVLESKWLEQASVKSDLISFWTSSVDQYVGKMKLPKNIGEKPRRFFHLHAMIHCIAETKPRVVWNLGVGNIKTNLPVLEYFIEQAKNQPESGYWINIDIVPEITAFNQKYLGDYANKKGLEPRIQENCIQLKNITIYNITATIEDFFSCFPIIKQQEKQISQLMLCLDGISNVAVPPEKWFSWWTETREKLLHYFEGWYVTWLQPVSLVRKFEFYYEVVYLRQKFPMHWVETTVFNIKSKNNEEKLYQSKLVDFSRFELTQVLKIIDTNNLLQTNSIFRFYADENKITLVYQATYLHEQTLQMLGENSKNEYIGHKIIDKLLFDVTSEFYAEKDQNFVKSIPHMYLKSLE